MKLFKTTKQHSKWWSRRKIDWVKSYASAEALNHPHRKLIVEALRGLSWVSLVEIGCGAGANLINIVNNLTGKQVGGIDISEEAIQTAKSYFAPNTFFKVCSADDIMMSDKSTDVVLSDMALIYAGTFKINDFIREMKRISRNYVVLLEFHSESWWDRFALKLNTGYNAYNWKKKLRQFGFYDIIIYKLKEEDWPGGNPQKTFAYLIIAKV